LEPAMNKFRVVIGVLSAGRKIKETTKNSFHP
jgi:hypothetical protein